MTSMTNDQQPRVLTLTRPKPRQRPTEDPPPPGAQLSHGGTFDGTGAHRLSAEIHDSGAGSSRAGAAGRGAHTDSDDSGSIAAGGDSGPTSRISGAAAGTASDDRPEDPAAAEMAAAMRELPALERAVGSLGVAIIEIFSGQRAPSSLGRWVTPELYERIRAHASRRQALARSAPPRSTLATAGSTRVCLITPHIAEASVVVGTGRRHRAVALRLEHIRRRWLLTRIETA